MNKSAGGPAYPCRIANGGVNEVAGWEGDVIQPGHESQYSGMSLRDHFAAAAIQGIIACFRDHTGAETIPKRVEKAYAYADAMLAERAK